ncbi:programmed cell death protein 2-like [Orussus abietinus]|uniref:programmed cell death protein 2-like n=1 Tax=Orussus abietinus TaxID=222816 RepID=UPI0006253419|nr:programmed cell death protein 2-like [Orussus abietinus]XP_012271288.1 programmed cell death protein 2-like [Orussus abietinus]
MAYDNRPVINLGYEDEFIMEKHRTLVNFTTNKIGGKPDWHNNETIPSAPQCRLCGLYQLLVLQLYVPLDVSKYHRTLYIFSCINPNCWNQNESWTCLRVQSLEEECTPQNVKTTTVPVPSSATSWLTDADDWGDNWNDNASEQNGNDLMDDSNKFHLLTKSVSFDDDLNDEFGNLQVEDPNANSPASIESPVGGGAVGRLDSPYASAEIEGEESEVVCIDTPTQPQCNLVSLLHEVMPLPMPLVESKAEGALTFVEIFISVDEEDQSVESSQHVRELFLEYQHAHPDSSVNPQAESDSSKDTDTSAEKYEKGIPLHGDEMFHNFLCRIQRNPGHILRYARDNNAALLLYPMGGCVGRCKHCGDEMIFELQVLPTIIPKLKLNMKSDHTFQIEFGTILIFTCVRSCWSSTDSYREEHVIVQAERL